MTKVHRIAIASAAVLAIATEPIGCAAADSNNNGGGGGGGESSSSLLRQRSAQSATATVEGNINANSNSRPSATASLRANSNNNNNNNSRLPLTEQHHERQLAEDKSSWVNSFFNTFSNTFSKKCNKPKNRNLPECGGGGGSLGGDDPLPERIPTPLFNVPTKPPTRRPVPATGKPTNVPTREPTLPPSPPPSVSPSKSPTLKPVEASTTTTTTTTTSTTTTPATTTLPPIPESCSWYPDMISNPTAITCVCDNPASAPDLYSTNDATKALYFFDNEYSCCTQWNCNPMPVNPIVEPTTTTATTTTAATTTTTSTTSFEECGNEEGTQECWYPHDTNTQDSSTDTKTCQKDASYPPTYHTTLLARKSFLFAHHADCCHHFPQACPENQNELDQKWYPDLESSSTKNNAITGIVDCVYDNEYPGYMMELHSIDTHLFDSQSECCTVYNCGHLLPKRWWPEVDLERGVLWCRYSNAYPLYMSEAAEEHPPTGGYLFGSEDECYEEWGLEGVAPAVVITPGPSGSPTAKPSASPTFKPSTSPTFKPSTSPTSKPSASPSPKPSAPPTSKPSASPSPKPTPLPVEPIVQWGTVKKWYPIIDSTDGSKSCNHGNDYPPTYYANDRNIFTYLFDSEDVCCQEYPEACLVATTTAATTTAASASSFEPCGKDGQEEECWYPHMDPFGNKLCAFDNTYPPDFSTNDILRESFLFKHEADCCHHFPEACPETTGVTIEMWYPDLDGAANGLINCLFGSDYPDFMTMASVIDSHLFNTEEDCCSEYSCGVVLEEKWYPEVDINEGIIVCLYGNGYPMYMAERPEGHLFGSEDECYDFFGQPPPTTTTAATTTMTSTTTTTTASTTTEATVMPAPPVDPIEITTEAPPTTTTADTITGLPEYWYPDIHSELNQCKFDDLYDSFMAKPHYHAAYLFSSKEGCCNKHDCGSMVEAIVTEATMPTTTTTTTTTLPTGPNGKTIYAYPDLPSNNDNCIMDDNYLDWMATGNNFKRYMFLSIRECCISNGYACTAEPTVAPSSSPSKSPTPPPTSSPSKTPTPPPTASPSKKPTPAPSAKPTPQPTASPSKKPTPAPSAKPTEIAQNIGSTTAKMWWYADIHADGNACVYGDGHESWQTRENGKLFEIKDECCLAIGCDAEYLETDATPVPKSAKPKDVVTFTNEDFESGKMDGLPFIHGGTTTHVADWHITKHKAKSGTHSLRSGNLNKKRGKSSDLTLKIDSISGLKVSFWYLADVGDPFDHFEFQLDGSLRHKDGKPTKQWQFFEMGVSPGPHEISFHLTSPSGAIKFDRSVSVDKFGSGAVMIDQLKVDPV